MAAHRAVAKERIRWGAECLAHRPLVGCMVAHDNYFSERDPCLAGNLHGLVYGQWAPGSDTTGSFVGPFGGAWCPILVPAGIVDSFRVGSSVYPA